MSVVSSPDQSSSQVPVQLTMYTFDLLKILWPSKAQEPMGAKDQ